MNTHWLSRDTILAIHEAQIGEHGGTSGLRDAELLDAAVEHPRQLAATAPHPPDAATLAAAYATELVRSRPFITDNQGVALVALELFLMLNGWALRADDVACVRTFKAFESGMISDKVFAEWVRECARPFAA